MVTVYQKKLIFYATAKRITVGTITQIEDGNFVTSFVGKLRGKIVSRPEDGAYKFSTQTEARECAHSFRQKAQVEARNLGLI
ncbi:hypothetical protein Ppro_3724 (plasmid) [Pelobacter propionicus DSM 2379]|jgi:hypothetical protein|uniref:Uncharacterized protein n=1 Tax=Pelobacter propionicus (strain DSM 2379 / NBRC 103807 / OttBd1) TaxID=338966 RepID=A0R7X2_PELPD|nr:hypothetical protein Ppro_3724 [Pelobacter propionicus DSM 2379]